MLVFDLDGGPIGSSLPSIINERQDTLSFSFMAPSRSLTDVGHLSLSYATIRRFPFSVVLIIFLLLPDKIRNADGAFFTPCNYPVPSDSAFETRCGNNYLHSTYICDVDRQISITAVEKIDSVLSKYEVFSKKYIRVGIAVLRILEYPNWTLVHFPEPQPSSEIRDESFGDHSGSQGANPESEDIRATKKVRRHDPIGDPPVGDPSSNPDWYCLSKSQASFYRSLDSDAHLINTTLVSQYLQTFADSLRIRWFGGECAADLFFLAITESVMDHSSGRNLLYPPLIQLSYGQELKRVLPKDFDHILQQELSSLSTRGWSPQPIIALAIERLGERLSVQKLIERRMTSVVVDANGQHRIVTAIVVQHSIPAWAIYTFIGCLGSVGLALGLEWTIVRRKALTLRAGGGGGGGERHRSSKSDNVQVHLYF